MLSAKAAAERTTQALTRVLVLAVFLYPAAQLLAATAPPAAADAAIESPWPYTVALEGGNTLEVYPPQLDYWNGHQLKVRAAVVMRERGSTGNSSDDRGTYGSVQMEGQTEVDKGTRTVELSHLNVTQAEFPSAGNESQAWVEALQGDLSKKTRSISLDWLEAEVKEKGVDLQAASAPLRNDAPVVLFSRKPALLISLDGAPRYAAVQGTALQRVINTRVLLLKDAGGRHYLHVFDGWMAAAALPGPWAVLASESADLRGVRQEAEQNHAADLLSGVTAATEQRQQDQQGASKAPAPSLKSGPLPTIFVATVPTELIVSDGSLSWKPIAGTQLLYASNTTGNVFRNNTDQNLYVLISGRWFRARGENGPWSYVASNALPADYARIPDDAGKENVKASVAGTPQAKEAAIAATVPQTAAVPISGTKIEALRFDGDPKWVAIAGTPLTYAINTPTPVIRIDERSYYAMENATWFVAASLKGPWVVATAVPAVVYSIPPSSPLYYVTFVRIYGSSGGVVYVGYTAGFQGTYIDPVTGVVVYGTGYVYDPWIGTTYIAVQQTYGYGASVTYTPWTGWFVGFCFGWAWGAATSAWDWGWGPYPYWGPWGWGWGGWWGGAVYGPYGGRAAWGPGGWAGFSGPIYQRWGSVASVSRYSRGFNAWTGNQWAGHSGVAYNSRTGRVAAGQRGVVSNVYTGNYAAGGRGVTRGPGGVIAAGQRGVAGNVYTGNAVAGNRGVVYNPATGQGTTYGGIRGQDGGIGHIGNDVYAGHDGDVYRNTGNGWQKHGSNGWEPVAPSGNLSGATRQPQAGTAQANLSGATRNNEVDRLSQDRQARIEGGQRDQLLRQSTDGMRQNFGSGRAGGQFGGFHGGRIRR